MKIRTFIDLTNRIYSVEIHVEDLSAREKELVDKFGSPEVPTGGNFAGSATPPGEVDPVSVDFDIPNRFVRLPYGFPIKRAFDLRDNENAAVKARVYSDVMSNRIMSAKYALLANDSAFTGETTITI